MRDELDYYELLGVRSDADDAVIAAAFRALAKKYHPDTGTHSGTASKERFIRIQEAFSVLGNSERRAAYDAKRKQNDKKSQSSSSGRSSTKPNNSNNSSDNRTDSENERKSRRSSNENSSDRERGKNRDNWDPKGGPSKGHSNYKGQQGLMYVFLSFDGRIERERWWLGAIALTILYLIAKGIEGSGEMKGAASLILVTIYIFILWASFALHAKRWHDRGKSGWWTLISFVPLIGLVWIIVECGMLRGTEGQNQYGPDPLAG